MHEILSVYLVLSSLGWKSSAVSDGEYLVTKELLPKLTLDNAIEVSV